MSRHEVVVKGNCPLLIMLHCCWVHCYMASGPSYLIMCLISLLVGTLPTPVPVNIIYDDDIAETFFQINVLLRINGVIIRIFFFDILEMVTNNHV